MPDNKEIKFSVQIDQQAVQQMQRIVRTLMGEVKELNKIMQGGGAGLGGARPSGVGGQGGGAGSQETSSFTKAIQNNQNALKGLKASSEQTTKAMGDILQRAMKEEAKAVEAATKKLEAHSAAYEELRKKVQQSGSNGRFTNLHSEDVRQLQGTGSKVTASLAEKAEADARLAGVEKQIKILEDIKTELKNENDKGGRGDGKVTGPGGESALDKIAKGFAKVTAFAQVAHALSGEAVRVTTASMTNQAKSAAAGGTVFGELTSGNFSRIAALQKEGVLSQIGTGMTASRWNSRIGSGAKMLMGAGGIIGGAFAGAKIGGVAGSVAPGIGNLIGGIGGALVGGGVAALGISKFGQGASELFQGGARAAEAAKFLELSEAARQSDPVYQRVVEDAISHAGSRTRAFRLRGGRGAYGANLMAGQGAGLGESEVTALQAQMAGMLGSSRANHLFGTAIGSERDWGVGISTAGKAISALSIGAGGGNLARGGNLPFGANSSPMTHWNLLMGGVADFGIKDSEQRDLIANLVADTQYGESGRTDAGIYAGQLAAATISRLGVNDTDLMGAQEIASGIHGLNSLHQQGGYYAAQRWGVSGQVLKEFEGSTGKDFNALHQSALSSASFMDLVKGSKHLDALGLNDSALRNRMLSQHYGSMFNTLPGFSKKLSAAGGDFKQAIAQLNPEEQALLAEGMKEQGLAKSVPQAQGMLENIVSMATLDVEGGQPIGTGNLLKVDGAAGTAEKDSAEASISGMNELFKRAGDPTTAAGISAAAKASIQFFDEFAKLGEKTESLNILQAIGKAIGDIGSGGTKVPMAVPTDEGAAGD